MTALSSYFEFIAAILLAFLGIKNFREDELILFNNGINKKLLLAENYFFESNNGSFYIKKKKKAGKKISEKAEKCISVLKELNQEYKLILENNSLTSKKTKPLFFFSFIYRIIILVFFIGFENHFKSYFNFQTLIFLNNIAYLNMFILLFQFTDSKRVFGFWFLGLLFIILEFINQILLNYFSVELSNIQLKIIAVFIPIFPFLIHYIIEYSYYLKKRKRVNVLLRLYDKYYEEMTSEFLMKLTNELDN